MDWTTKILSDQEFREAMTAEIIEAIRACKGDERGESDINQLNDAAAHRVVELMEHVREANRRLSQHRPVSP